MRSPQLEDGFYQFAYELDAAISAVGFGRYESIILHEVRAAMFGPAKEKSVAVSPAEFGREWNLCRTAFSQALHKLVRMNVLVQVDDTRNVRLNKAYESWRDAHGNPQFTPKMVERIALASAKAMGRKYGRMPAKMVRAAMEGIGREAETTPPLRGKASHFHDAERSESATVKRSESATVKDDAVVKALRPPYEKRYADRSESATVALKGTGAMDTGDTERESKQASPLPPPGEPILSDEEYVVKQATDHWWQIQAEVARAVRILIKDYQNLALVQYAINEHRDSPTGPKDKFSMKFLRVVCEENAKKFAGKKVKRPLPAKAAPPERKILPLDGYSREELTHPALRGKNLKFGI